MVQRTPTARKASKDSASAAAKVAAAAAAAAVTTSASTSAAVPLGRSPGADSLIDSRMLARDVTVRCAHYLCLTKASFHNFMCLRTVLLDLRGLFPAGASLCQLIAAPCCHAQW